MPHKLNDQPIKNLLFFPKRATSAHQKIMKIAARDAPSQKAISYCKSFRFAFLRINKTSEGTYLSL